MTIKESSVLSRVLEKLEVMDERSQKIERGMYGDKTNHFKGLIQRQDDDELKSANLETRISKIEYNGKLLWRWGSVFVGSGGVLYVIWDKIIDLVK